jgi:hypothetical protein
MLDEDLPPEPDVGFFGRDETLLALDRGFDRHFLNQMSEAMKRRFVFIDILPPGREQHEAEQGMALYRALCDLAVNGMFDVTTDPADADAVRRARELGVLFYLRDELFEHILPRIVRRLSFESPRTTIVEEPPTRGRID